MLLAADADLESRDQHQRTPLLAAAQAQQLEVMEVPMDTIPSYVESVK